MAVSLGTLRALELAVELGDRSETPVEMQGVAMAMAQCQATDDRPSYHFGVTRIEAAPAELDQRAGDLLRLSSNAP